jgi:Secreted protein containing C-terminal beta-propeller domain distantly related to WD-40 repeats
MKPLRIPVKYLLIAFCIVIIAFLAIQAIPRDSVPGFSGSNPENPLPFISPNADNPTLSAFSNNNAPLPVFSSAEEVRTFLKFHTAPYTTVQHSRRWFSGSTGTIHVTDCNDTRIWRYTLDTASFKPDEYLVIASAVNEDARGTALFNVLSGVRTEKLPKMNRTVHVPAKGEKYYITVDPVGDRYVGERATITGSTNLPVGEDILVEVYTSSFTPTQKSQSGEFSGATATTGNAGSSGSPEYSTTNIQAAGVDEADIVKTDGTNIYAISGNTLRIVRAYPAEEARTLANLTTNGTPVSLYVNGDRLVLFTTEITDGDIACGYTGTGDYSQKTHILIYSISDPEHPMLLREIDADGDYLNSRMIGPYLYFITTRPVDSWSDNLAFPQIREKNRRTITPAVYNFGQNNSAFSYDLGGAVNIRTDDPVKALSFLTGTDSTVYVSPQHLYLGLTAPGDSGYRDMTDMYAFFLDNGTIRYTASGEVNGTLLNQYSLDEYKGNLRVATSVTEPGSSWREPDMRYSNVFILDEHLNVTGKIEHIAPSEILHSTRFMGDRLYMVTFQELDPFFVIDLSDPVKPKILGELKLPGFSEYLHPYDDSHIIGIGKETVQNENGGTVSRGIKVSLFDVSNVSSPSAIDSIELGGRGSESAVFSDPKAFLFDREKNLLVLPVYLKDLPEAVWTDPASNQTSVQNGTLIGTSVFGIDPARGFTGKGTVIHAENTYSASPVERALYINDTLYTLSRDEIIASDLGNLTRTLNRISLK